MHLKHRIVAARRARRSLCAVGQDDFRPCPRCDEVVLTQTISVSLPSLYGWNDVVSYHFFHERAPYRPVGINSTPSSIASVVQVAATSPVLGMRCSRPGCLRSSSSGMAHTWPTSNAAIVQLMSQCTGGAGRRRPSSLGLRTILGAGTGHGYCSTMTGTICRDDYEPDRVKCYVIMHVLLLEWSGLKTDGPRCLIGVHNVK